LTKKFEEVVRGKLSEVLEHFKTKAPKGEFVIVFQPGCSAGEL
jgi:16S rRNA (cytidine1402-2'-O)-methyltransferase